MTKIYLMRHGETEWNKLTKLQGHEDIELNETGRKQATVVACYYDSINVDVIYTSPLKRAKETGGIIGRLQGVKHIFEENDLIERDYGVLSGLTLKERKERYPNGHHPDVESNEMVQERMMTALTKIANLNHGKNIIVVSHGSAINSVLAYLTEGKIGTRKTKLHTCCINLLNYENDAFHIEYYNKKVY